MSTSLSLLFLGATTTISLVAAIGAQGTFVLRQGITGRHITPIIIFCVLSDALMIGLGVVGLGALLDAAPWVMEVLRYVGAAFLAWFGYESAKRVFTPHAVVVEEGTEDAQSLKAALLTTAAVTYLNPLAWLDTTILLGSLANTQGDPGRWWYYLGCCCGSVLWFLMIGATAHEFYVRSSPARRPGVYLTRRWPYSWCIWYSTCSPWTYPPTSTIPFIPCQALFPQSPPR